MIHKNTQKVLEKPHGFWGTQRVYMEDVDVQGVVYHANYLRFFDRQRTDYLYSLKILDTTQEKTPESQFVVRTCQLDFRQGARLGDELNCHTYVTHISGACLFFEQTLEKQGQILVQLHAKLVYVTKEGRPTRVPQALREALLDKMHD